MQNVEFKAELRNLDAARRQCQLLGAEPVGAFKQEDTYYKLADCRLKRRESPGEDAQWIFYHRPNRIAPRTSTFTILTESQARRRWGTHSLRQWLKVSKTRELWMAGDVRIHLDQVENLGTFIEFEARVSRRCDARQCHQAIATLRQEFAPVLGEPVSASYSDLMDQAMAEGAK